MPLQPDPIGNLNISFETNRAGAGIGVRRQDASRHGGPWLRLVWDGGKRVAPLPDTAGSSRLRDGPAAIRLIATEGGPPGPSSMAETGLSGLTALLLADLAPAAVSVPLIAADCDAVDLLHRLRGLGYAGRVIVRCPPLPAPDLVERELSRHAAGLAINLVSGD
ncbi:hypothetical protein SAMN05421763_101224 [[Luteovulum] sphaeroides subsp. megalophilum]|nr:hypothetical protein SAMN05421763_101224 [[Luteovulum] sphaeroides subsp. megalophilum]